MKNTTTLKVYALKKNETEFKNTQITSSESAVCLNKSNFNKSKNKTQ